MGYESRVYVVNVVPMIDGGIAEVIATVDMSCMGNDSGWRELFDTPMECGIPTDYGVCTLIDTYGDSLKYTTRENVIAWLENEIKKCDENNRWVYRRLMPLLGLLRGIEPDKWNSIRVVHFGY